MYFGVGCDRARQSSLEKHPTLAVTHFHTAFYTSHNLHTVYNALYLQMMHAPISITYDVYNNASKIHQIRIISGTNKNKENVKTTTMDAESLNNI